MSSLPADVLADLGRVFDSLEAGWYLFGAQAAAMHGAPRLTIDVDVTVMLGRAKDLDDVTAILRARAKTFRYDLARETLSLLEQALDRRDLLPLLQRAEHQADVVVTTGAKQTKKKRSPANGNASRPARRKKSKKSRR